jgi:hypothetical protein
MSKVVLFAAALLLVAGIATAGILDPELSTAMFMDATGGDTFPTGALPFVGPGCYFACPQGDTQTFALAGNFLRPPGAGPGMSIEFICLNSLGQPIPDIPRSDFWLIDNNNNIFPPSPPAPAIGPLALCVGQACIDADAASDANGWAEIEDEQFKVGSCTHNLAAVVQGFVITTAGIPVNFNIETHSVDLDGSLDVQLADLAIFAQMFPPAAYHPCADYDCSGPPIGLPDLARFAFHFGPPGHACQ